MGYQWSQLERRVESESKNECSAAGSTDPPKFSLGILLLLAYHRTTSSLDMLGYFVQMCIRIRYLLKIKLTE